MDKKNEKDASIESVGKSDKAFSQLGIAKIVWQNENVDNAKVVSCNEAFLGLFGFEDGIINADKAAVVATINIALIKTVLSLIPEHAKESFTTGHSHGFLQKIDGSRIEVSCWAEMSRLNDRLICELVVAPTEQAAYLDCIESKSELIAAFSAVYDLVIDVDLLKGSACCVHNVVGGSALAPTEIPLNLDSAISEWTKRYLTEESQRLFAVDVEPLLKADTQSSVSVLHRSSVALVHGHETPIDLLVYRDGTYLLLAIKLKGNVSERPDCNHHVHIRTFGYFEIFVDGNPVIFKHPKSRELLALLVDRRGGFVGSRVAAALLWDDKEPDDTVMARYRKIAMYLSDSLEEVGIPFLVESVRGNRRVNFDSVECDLIDYLRLGEKAPVQFSGAYMNEYSWAEQTKGELIYQAERVQKNSNTQPSND